jgi:hypothetical protein
VKDWVDWHRSYDDPDSSLSRRLAVVRQRLSETLDVGRTPATILSLCAGDGRDILPVLATRPPGSAVVRLVEQDDALAARARASADAAGLPGVDVTCGDAGAVTTFVDLLPVDLLMLCGVFGNVTPEDVARTVALVPTLVTPGGFVVWTRGRSEPDLRPTVRRWFRDAGLDEVSFDGEPESFGIGVARLPDGAARTDALPDRLFTFVR